MPYVVGIDPGQDGAIAVLDRLGNLQTIHDMPIVDGQVSPALLSDLFKELVDESLAVTAVIEQVHSMPRQGVASSFKFGKSYGIVLGALAGLHVRTEHVTPARWKRAMRLSAEKDQARRRAIERWPGHAEMFKRKKDADRAEAALLALWFIEQKAERP